MPIYTIHKIIFQNINSNGKLFIIEKTITLDIIVIDYSWLSIVMQSFIITIFLSNAWNDNNNDFVTLQFLLLCPYHHTLPEYLFSWQYILLVFLSCIFKQSRIKMWTQFPASLYDRGIFIELFNSIHTPATRFECTFWFFSPPSSCLLFLLLCCLLLNIFFLEKNSNGSILIHISHIMSRMSRQMLHWIW